MYRINVSRQVVGFQDRWIMLLDIYLTFGKVLCLGSEFSNKNLLAYQLIFKPYIYILLFKYSQMNFWNENLF